MNAFHRRTVHWLWLPCLAAVIAATSSSQDIGIGVGVAGRNVAANFTVLTSGPLNEGFARPVVYTGARVAYLNSTPPEMIAETPPADHPEGAIWISGYWNFDDSSRQWVWVSGSWRVPPPGYTWVPGYWYRSSMGWRYVNGYWAAATSVNADIDYLPEPPSPLDVAAIDTAPYSDAIWVSGNWMWSGSAYAWRNGYWMHARRDWTWMPASYTWTPYGYVFTDGYWDYSLARRGLLYAPVAFPSGTYVNAGFNFSPGYAINVGLFSDSLFVNPGYDMYYFGDYYAPTWWGLGYYPAYAFHLTSYGYDPLFAYASWQSGSTSWVEDRRARFTQLQSNVAARPPRTLAEASAKPVPKPGTTEGETAHVAVPVKEAAKVTPLTMQTTPAAQISTQTSALTAARNERIKVETQAGAGMTLTQPRKVKASSTLMPNAEMAAKTTVTLPEKPELPKGRGRREGWSDDRDEAYRALAGPSRGPHWPRDWRAGEAGSDQARGRQADAADTDAGQARAAEAARGGASDADRQADPDPGRQAHPASAARGASSACAGACPEAGAGAEASGQA